MYASNGVVSYHMDQVTLMSHSLKLNDSIVHMNVQAMFCPILLDAYSEHMVQVQMHGQMCKANVQSKCAKQIGLARLEPRECA